MIKAKVLPQNCPLSETTSYNVSVTLKPGERSLAGRQLLGLAEYVYSQYYIIIPKISFQEIFQLENFQYKSILFLKLIHIRAIKKSELFLLKFIAIKLNKNPSIRTLFSPGDMLLLNIRYFAHYSLLLNIVLYIKYFII